MRYNLDDLAVAILALIAGVAIVASISCSSKPSAPEPEWKPEIYLYSPDQARCVLVSGNADKIDCDEPRMHDIACIQIDELKALKFKLQRCEEWR